MARLTVVETDLPFSSCLCTLSQSGSRLSIEVYSLYFIFAQLGHHLQVVFGVGLQLDEGLSAFRKKAEKSKILNMWWPEGLE